MSLFWMTTLRYVFPNLDFVLSESHLVFMLNYHPSKAIRRLMLQYLAFLKSADALHTITLIIKDVIPCLGSIGSVPKPNKVPQKAFIDLYNESYI